MKRPNILFSIASVSFISLPVICYWEGQSNSWWVFPPMFPASALPFLALLISCIALLCYWIRALATKRSAAIVGLMFFVSVAMFGILFLAPPARFFHYGFHRYAKAVLTPDEWRSMARFAQERLGPEGRLPGPDKSLWQEKEHRSQWSDLCHTTQIQKLNPSLTISVHPEETEIGWGSPLSGHRAVIIFISKGVGNHDRLPQAMFIADDIATIITAD